jgi:sugar O-acyltransferase (sialic acid O-acetyltransferase NeuD family)
MLSVIIYGAGGHGQEIAWITERTGQFKVIGFFDNFFKQDTYCGYPILNNLSSISKHSFFIIAIGDTTLRKKIVTELIKDGFYNFPSIIDPSAIVSSNASIGDGVIVFPKCVISTNVVLNDFSNINTGTIISHRAVIGKYSNICPNVSICGDVKIEDAVFIGAGATINDHISIEEQAIIGSGAVVTRNVIKNSLYAGVPATFKKLIGEQT